MMSQIVMSILTGSFAEPVTVSSFLETFVPRVWMYLSSKSSRTKRRIRDVLPTAASPTRHTFTFIRRMSTVVSAPRTWDTRGGPHKRFGWVIRHDTPEGVSPALRLPHRSGRKALVAAVPMWGRGPLDVRRVRRREDAGVLARDLRREAVAGDRRGGSRGRPRGSRLPRRPREGGGGRPA